MTMKAEASSTMKVKTEVRRAQRSRAPPPYSIAPKAKREANEVPIPKKLSEA
jgi:hypothetical protein